MNILTCIIKFHSGFVITKKKKKNVLSFKLESHCIVDVEKLKKKKKKVKSLAFFSDLCLSFLDYPYKLKCQKN